MKKMICTTLKGFEVLNQLQGIYKIKFKKNISLGDLLEKILTHPTLLTELRRDLIDIDKIESENRAEIKTTAATENDLNPSRFLCDRIWNDRHNR